MRILTTFLLCFFFLTISSEVYAIEQKTESYTIDSMNKTVKYVKFNINENFELKPVLAKDRVGKVDSLANIAKQEKAVAAINGTYFNPYDKNDLQPLGGIIINRNPVHLAGGTDAMGISQGNELGFSKASDVKIKGGINGSREWPNNWYAWHINHLPTSQDAIVVFTSTFRSSMLDLPGFTFIVVSNGKVTKRSKNKITIPTDGFVIAYGSNAIGADKFSVGDSAEFYIEYPEAIKNALHMISVGPKLVTNGKESVDLTGFQEDKITKFAAQRSFIGITKSQDILFGTVNNITIHDLAELALKMGLMEAMSLDGGASSGLYFDGKYITSPGRNISNALTVVKRENYPRIKINGEEIIFPDAKPFIDSANRTLIPVRFLANELGAKVDWNAKTRTVMVTRGNKEIKLVIGKSEAVINGNQKILDTKARIVNNRTFVPVRFITETFGAKVEYDREKRMVMIATTLFPAETYYQNGLKLLEEGNDAEALVQFERAAHLDEDLLGVWNHIGSIYMKNKKYDKAVEAYKKSHQVQSLISLGWAAYSNKDFNLAIQSFSEASKYKDIKGASYYGLGVTYMHYQVNKKQEAKALFQKVIELSQNEEMIKNSRSFLESL